jgi:hypothetical protein
MGTFKRQTHGIRVNLTKLQQDIDELEQDKQEMYRLGYDKEAKAIGGKLNQLYAMQQDATKHGYGYYDYKVSNAGRRLMVTVAIVLAVLLAIGYLLVVLG